MLPELVAKFSYKVPVEDITSQWASPKTFYYSGGVLAVIDENGDVYAIPTRLWYSQLLTGDENVAHMFHQDRLRAFGQSVVKALVDGGFVEGNFWVPWCAHPKMPFEQELRDEISARRHRLMQWLYEQDKKELGQIPINWRSLEFSAV